MLLQDVIEKLSNEQIDKLVAEKVMGWHWVPFDKSDPDRFIHLSDPDGMWLDAENKFHHNDFLPSLNISQAWEVVESQRIWSVTIENLPDHPREIVCRFYKPFTGFHFFAVAETAPLAICRAALLALA